MWLRKVSLIAVLALFGAVGAHAQVANITGNLKTLGVANATQNNTYVNFTLQNYGSNIPRVIGTNAIVSAISTPFKPNSSGNISGTLQENSSISPANTFYRVCIYFQGTQFQCNNFFINADFNLNTATPITTVVPPPANAAPANHVFAGPTSGSPGTPGFRPLLGADLPFPGPSALGGVNSIDCSLLPGHIQKITITGLPVCSLDTGGGGGSAGTPFFSIQYNNGGLFAGASGILTDGNNLPITGPDPHRDVISYGAAGVPLGFQSGSIFHAGSTTLTTLTLVALKNGQTVRFTFPNIGNLATATAPSGLAVTPHGTGATTVTYKVACVDRKWGESAASSGATITNSTATHMYDSGFTNSNYNHLSWSTSAGCTYYHVYRGSTSLGITSNLRWDDYGQPSVTIDPGLPTSPQVAPTRGYYYGKIVSGGGTQTLTMDTAAAIDIAATAQLRRDDSAAFQAAHDAATSGDKIYISPGTYDLTQPIIITKTLFWEGAGNEGSVLNSLIPGFDFFRIDADIQHQSFHAFNVVDNQGGTTAIHFTDAAVENLQTDIDQVIGTGTNTATFFATDVNTIILNWSRFQVTYGTNYRFGEYSNPVQLDDIRLSNGIFQTQVGCNSWGLFQTNYSGATSLFAWDKVLLEGPVASPCSPVEEPWFRFGGAGFPAMIFNKVEFAPEVAATTGPTVALFFGSVGTGEFKLVDSPFAAIGTGGLFDLTGKTGNGVSLFLENSNLSGAGQPIFKNATDTNGIFCRNSDFSPTIAVFSAGGGNDMRNCKGYVVAGASLDRIDYPTSTTTNLLERNDQSGNNIFVVQNDGTLKGGATLGGPARINEGTAPSGISATDVIYGKSSTHWPAFNPNVSGERNLCGSTGSFTSGHIVAANATGTTCDLVDGGTGTGSGTVTNFSANNITTGTQNFATQGVTSPGVTPALTFTIANAPAHTVFGNSTGGSAAPDYVSLSAAMEPATTVNSVVNDTNVTGAISGQALTLGWTGTLAAARQPATTVNSVVNDTNVTGSIAAQALTLGWTGALGAARGGTGQTSYTKGDTICPSAATTITKLAVGANARVLTANSAATCGIDWEVVPSGVVIDTNAVDNSSQTLLNFTSTSGATGITFSNPSGGVESAVLANTDGSGNSVTTSTLTGFAQGDYLCGDATPKFVNCVAGVPLNAQTGTTYTVLSTDRGKLITHVNASAIAVTLPQASSTGFANNFFVKDCNIGTGTNGAVTYTPTTSTINGAATLVLLVGQCASIFSDNTNYTAVIDGRAAATSGSISGAIVGIGCDSATVTINGAATGMDAHATPNTYPGDGIFWNAYVSSANTVTVKVCSDVTVTPTASTYNVRLFNP